MFPQTSNPNALPNMTTKVPVEPVTLTKREYFMLVAPVPDGLSAYSSAQWAKDWADYIMGDK